MYESDCVCRIQCLCSLLVWWCRHPQSQLCAGFSLHFTGQFSRSRLPKCCAQSNNHSMLSSLSGCFGSCPSVIAVFLTRKHTGVGFKRSKRCVCESTLRLIHTGVFFWTRAIWALRLLWLVKSEGCSHTREHSGEPTLVPLKNYGPSFASAERRHDPHQMWKLSTFCLACRVTRLFQLVWLLLRLPFFSLWRRHASTCCSLMPPAALFRRLRNPPFLHLRQPWRPE